MTTQTRFAQIAQFILTNMKQPLRPSDRTHLERLIAGNRDADHLYLEFRDEADVCNCSLTVSVECDFSAPRIENEAGDLLREYHLLAQVNWPSYGSTQVGTARKRIEMMRDVCDLAEAVTATFGAPYMEVVATKAERDESAERAAEHKARTKVEGHLKEYREMLKGLRVGGQRLLPNGDLPAGTMADLTGGRSKERYSVYVNDGSTVVTRTA